MTGDKSYMLGYILGDGMIRHYHRHGYEVRITEKNGEHAEYIASVIKDVYGVRARLTRDRYSDSWRIRVYRKSFYERVLLDLRQAVSNPDEDFISGLFDAEGDYTVSKHRLRFTNKDSMIVRLVEIFLEKHSIRYHTYRREKGEQFWFTIEIYGKNIASLLNKIKLRHPKWRKMYTHIQKKRPGAPARMVGTVIGPKAPVAGSASSCLNPWAQPRERWEYYRARGRERPGVLPG